jgi:putative pyruvate formate lyase activating enzyme
VMDQYRPCGNARKDENTNRRLTAKEYRDAVSAAKNAGLTRLDTRDRMRLILGF